MKVFYYPRRCLKLGTRCKERDFHIFNSIAYRIRLLQVLRHRVPKHLIITVSAPALLEYLYMFGNIGYLPILELE